MAEQGSGAPAQDTAATAPVMPRGSVTQKHPEYDERAPIWQMMRDCYEGEEEIKSKATTYLPMPLGFAKQADGGAKMYGMYIIRAQFPDIVIPTLSGMVGVIHRIDAQIEGLEDGKPLAYMWEKATKDGLTLEAFHRKITAELLLMGKYAILTDAPAEGGDPYFVGYGTELLINWSDPDRDMYVLDESRKVHAQGDIFSWADENRYRALYMQDGVYNVQMFDQNNLGGEVITPQMTKGAKFEEIPFVVAGPKDLSLGYNPPPLLGVARASIAIYRLDADYRHQMFYSGQETLFVIGEVESPPAVVGSGVVVGLPAGSDAKYVGPSGSGIAAHRVAIQDERQAAVAAGVRLFDTQAKAESGEALRLRSAAQTATLTTIAQTSAAALEKSLRYAAMFVGQDPKEIVVKPNLEFVDTAMTPQDGVYLMNLWQGGAISKTTLYDNLQKGELASAERTFEEEQSLIDQEVADMPQQNQQPQLGGPNPRLNGGTPPAGNGSVPSRFVETGDGLTIE